MKKTYEQGYINGFAQSKKKIEELEQALDEIEKYIKNHKREIESHIYGLTIPKFVFNGDIEDILEIIQKAKGDVKNENNNI